MMGIRLAIIAAGISWGVGAWAQTGIEQTIGFEISQHDPRLKAIFGGGGSALCFPTSLAHRMIHQALVRRPALSKLDVIPMTLQAPESDLVEQVKIFYKNCGTHKDKGTSVYQGEHCIRQFYLSSGYQPRVTSIGVAATEPKNRRWPTLADIRSHLNRGFGTIAHVGWYFWDQGKRQWVRDGGHFFNIYGYRSEDSWGEQRIELQVVNPDVDYAGRGSDQDFDWVGAQRITPKDPRFFLSGEGFNKKGGKRAIVEDLLEFLPESEL